MNLMQMVNRLSPMTCRLLARKNNGTAAKTFVEIATASGLSLSTVKDYSKRRTWDGIPINNVMAYSLACGVDHLDSRREIEFLKRRKWTHVLDAKDPRQQQMFKRILACPNAKAEARVSEGMANE